MRKQAKSRREQTSDAKSFLRASDFIVGHKNMIVLQSFDQLALDNPSGSKILI
jgi:hypothetical protein